MSFQNYRQSHNSVLILFLILYPAIRFVSLHHQFQNIWKWSAIELLHSLQQFPDSGLPFFKYFLLRVIKNLIMFLNENPLHWPELEVVDCILQIFSHSSSVRVMFASFFQLALTYKVEWFLEVYIHEYVLDTSFFMSIALICIFIDVDRLIPVSLVILVFLLRWCLSCKYL